MSIDDTVSAVKSFSDFLLWERSSYDTIDVKKTYIDMAQDLIAGIVLSQIIYWHLPSKNTDRTKLRIERDGHLWIARTRAEWWAECRTTIKQVERALSILRDLGIIETRIYKFKNNPTVHIRVIENEFLKAWDKAVKEPAAMNTFRTRAATKGNTGKKRVVPKKEITILPNRKERKSLKGNIETPSLGTTYNTESTPEITSEKTTKITIPDDVVAPFDESAFNDIAAQEERLRSSLEDLGVIEKVIDELMGSFPHERIEMQLKYLPARDGINPAGMLVSSIRDNWDPPSPRKNGESKRTDTKKGTMVTAEDVIGRAQYIAEKEYDRLPEDRRRTVNLALKEGKLLIDEMGKEFRQDLKIIAREQLMAERLGNSQD